MNDQKIVLFLLLCFTAGSNSQGTPCSDPNQKLKNVVVFEGEPSSFFNQIDPNQVTWTIAPSYDPEAINGGSPTPPYTVADDGITPYPDVYTVTPTQLSIPKSSINPQFNDPYSTSGLYMVTYKSDGCQSFANLIVISKGPDCQCNMIDSDKAELTCLIEYGITRFLPNHATMTWTTDSGDEVRTETNESNKENPTYDISTSTYQVTSSGAASYTCTVTFTPPDNVYPNMATNAPTTNASCTIENCVKATATTTEESSTDKPTSSNSQAPPCTDPTQHLKNVVVFEGEPSSFFNQLDPNQVTWTIFPSYDPEAINGGNPTPPYTVADDGITPYPGVYTVTPTQLSIPMSSINPQFNDSYSTSGFYTVTYKSDGCQELANLIVISKGPDCQCNMVDSDNADLTCLIEYGVTRLLPNRATMTWTTDSGDKVLNETNESNKDNPTYDISTSTYQVTSSGAAQYTCTVTFTPPDNEYSNMATNAPSFNASCTVANCVKATATTTEESTTATPNCSKDLINIVVYEGSEAVFENADDGKPVKWHFSSSSDPFDDLLDITDYDNTVNTMFAGAYSVTKTKLTILSATIAPNGNNPYATAGLYFLTYQSTGCQTAANLIVIQSRPACDRNENDPNNVFLTCNISYAESERQPSYPTMTWTTGSGVFLSDNPTTQKYAYVYDSLSVIAVDNTAPSYYQCEITFNVPASHPIPFVAQNAPSYTESCSVATSTIPPTTEIATTTEVCVDRPNCSSKWLSNPKAFCPYVQQFEDDCPAFCTGCQNA